MYTLTEALSDIVYHATSLTAGGATHCYPELPDGTSNSDAVILCAGGGTANPGACNSTTLYIRNQHADSNSSCTFSVRTPTAGLRTLVGTSWR